MFLGTSFSGAFCGGLYSVLMLIGISIYDSSSRLPGSAGYIWLAALIGGITGGIAGIALGFISGVLSPIIAAFTANIENYNKNVTIGNLIIGGLTFLGLFLFTGNSLTSTGPYALLYFIFIFILPVLITTGVMVLLGRTIGGWYRDNLFSLTH